MKYTENFRDIVNVFRRADALCVVTPQSLTPTMLHLLESHEDGSIGTQASK